jgi:hypothetical protein
MVSVMDIAQLQTGEKQLGEYLVQIARPSGSGWVAGIPPITARITSRRLILIPQTRKPYPPASIPGIHILKVNNILLGQRRAVQICLKIGYNLNLFVGWGQGEDFARYLKRMLVPSLRGHYTPVLSEAELMRLIEQISQL